MINRSKPRVVSLKNWTKKVSCFFELWGNETKSFFLIVGCFLKKSSYLSRSWWVIYDPWQMFVVITIQPYNIQASLTPRWKDKVKMKKKILIFFQQQTTSMSILREKSPKMILRSLNIATSPKSTLSAIFWESISFPTFCRRNWKKKKSTKNNICDFFKNGVEMSQSSQIWVIIIIFSTKSHQCQQIF